MNKSKIFLSLMALISMQNNWAIDLSQLLEVYRILTIVGAAIGFDKSENLEFTDSLKKKIYKDNLRSFRMVGFGTGLALDTILVPNKTSIKKNLIYLCSFYSIMSGIKKYKLLGLKIEYEQIEAAKEARIIGGLIGAGLGTAASYLIFNK